MGEIIRRRLRQSQFESPSHEAVLNLLVAAGHVRDEAAKACLPFGITPPQYNVLRILRGVHPGGYPRCEIARRMIERAPDLTRLIDRLERRGLVERARSTEDRRHSITRITRRGIEAVAEVHPALEALQDRVSERLSRAECETLSALLEKLYEGAPDATASEALVPVMRPRAARARPAR